MATRLVARVWIWICCVGRITVGVRLRRIRMELLIPASLSHLMAESNRMAHEKRWMISLKLPRVKKWLVLQVAFKAWLEPCLDLRMEKAAGKTSSSNRLLE